MSTRQSTVKKWARTTVIAGALAVGLALCGQVQVSAADPSPGIAGPDDPAIVQYRDRVDALIEGYNSGSADERLSGAADLIAQMQTATEQLQAELGTR
jgi:hypothetical protein